jgi:class 3 adenylate cyclase
MTRFEGRYTLVDADDGGCVVSCTLTSVPRYFFMRPIVWLVQRGKVSQLRRFIARIDEALLAHEEMTVIDAPCDRERARDLGASLEADYGKDLVAKLVEEIATSGDVDALRMRPFELARTWGEDRDATLRLCLGATRAGLLELRWAVLCPSCRTVAQRIPSLAELAAGGHCPSCDIRFGVELDRTVEATFAPHPSVRRVDDRPFCVGGPMLMPHVLTQAIARPPEAAILRVPDDAGRYRLFVRGGGVAVVDAAEGAPARVEVVTREVDGEPALEPAQIDVAPGGEVALVAPGPLHAKLERTQWTFDAATAMHVSALPEFREQFGGDALRPGLALKVGRVGVLFSDLVGSTALYSRVGDASAFGVVTDCLDFGRAIVEEAGGTVVKTMGDAIMAAFSDPAAAVRAGAEMVARWGAFAASKPAVADVDIKVGVAAGPCTIVTANGVLDYFGQTVNTAARVQHLAGAREIVVAAELCAGELEGLAVRERFEARVKGIDAPLSLVRLGLP